MESSEFDRVQVSSSSLVAGQSGLRWHREEGRKEEGRGREERKRKKEREKRKEKREKNITGLLRFVNIQFYSVFVFV